ncbi:MAG TPA: hypothetical protein VFY71_05530, partial [Planctomycetota bacterium]|nr:hypothetical protein [Planctomycetota bacterium]
ATDTDGYTQWLPDALLPGAASYSFFVGTTTSVFADGFEGPGDNGWTHVQLATQDDWQRGAPLGKAGDPAAAEQGSAVWGNDLGGSGFNGEYQPDVHNRLESPAISTLGQHGLRLRFQRWLTVEDGFYDQATVLVNGVPVWSNPATPGGGTAHTLDSAWTPQDLDVSALADDQAAVHLRFELQSDGGLQFGGWNIDDLKLVTVAPGTLPPLVASAVHVSAAQGGSVALSLDAGAAFAGRTYLVLVSATGSSPTPVGSVLLPLHFDPVTNLGISLVNTPIFGGFLGTLSPQGTAAATFASPPAAIPELPGLTLTFAFLTLGPIDFASNAVGVQYQP